MGGILDLLQGAVSAGNQAKGAYVNRSIGDTESLIQYIQQARAQQIAQQRQAEMDQSTLDYRRAQTDKLTHPDKKVVFDAEGNPVSYDPANPQFPVGFKGKTTPDPVKVHAANRKFDVENPLPRVAAPGSGEQVVNTPDGVVIVDKKTATSRPVAKPGVSVGVTGGTGQLQPRASGNQKLQALAIENRNQMNVIDEAIRRIQANPKALGAKNLLPDIIMQRADPEGVATRAAVADIGSLKIHERSGAAVTASESPRLMPFVPSVKDTPQAALDKLKRLRAYLDQETQALEAAGAVVPKAGGYSPDNPFAKP